MYQDHSVFLTVELMLVCMSFRRTFRSFAVCVEYRRNRHIRYKQICSASTTIAGGSQTHVGAEVAKSHRRHPLHRVIFRPDERHEDVESPFLQDRIAVLQVRRKVSEGPSGFSRNQGRGRSERLLRQISFNQKSGTFKLFLIEVDWMSDEQRNGADGVLLLLMGPSTVSERGILRK